MVSYKLAGGVNCKQSKKEEYEFYNKCGFISYYYYVSFWFIHGQVDWFYFIFMSKLLVKDT